MTGTQQNIMMPFTLRTIQSEAKYQADKKAGRTIPLHKEPILQRFTHWFLIDNRYPYDAAFTTHHMLLPYSRVSHRNELNEAELRELKEIFTYFVEPNYDVILDNTTKRRSVTDHYHIHLLTYKIVRASYEA